MQAAKIMIPFEEDGGGKSDLFILQSLMQAFHDCAKDVHRDYKFAVTFPKMSVSDHTFGNEMLLFAPDKESLAKHMGARKAASLLDELNYSIHEINLDMLDEKVEWISSSKDHTNSHICPSKVKKAIKWIEDSDFEFKKDSLKYKIKKLHEAGLSPEEISNKLAMNRLHLFISSKSTGSKYPLSIAQKSGSANPISFEVMSSYGLSPIQTPVFFPIV